MTMTTQLHPLSSRLRAIANVLDFLQSVNLGTHAEPIDGNASFEISQIAYEYCQKSDQGRELLNALTQAQCWICRYDHMTGAPNPDYAELSDLLEE